MLLISLGEVVAINYTLTTLTLLYVIEVQKQSIIMRASKPCFSEHRDFNDSLLRDILIYVNLSIS